MSAEQGSAFRNSVLRDRRLPSSADVRQRPTPQTTIEAILYCVRVRGTKALHEPANIERLSRCDAATIDQIDARIAKFTDGSQ